MPTAAQLAFLEERGWSAETFDLCWLDCSRPDGRLKTWARPGSRALCICLCPEHAVVLEEGCFHGDYEGAPLPPSSGADEWPWQYCEDAL